MAVLNIVLKDRVYDICIYFSTQDHHIKTRATSSCSWLQLRIANTKYSLFSLRRNPPEISTTTIHKPTIQDTVKASLVGQHLRFQDLVDSHPKIREKSLFYYLFHHMSWSSSNSSSCCCLGFQSDKQHTQYNWEDLDANYLV